MISVDYDVILKRGDTRHAIKAILKDANKDPVDLTNCDVTFVMAPIGRPAIINRTAYIHDASNGEVWVVFRPGDTDMSDVYQAEFKVVYPDGKKETFPNFKYIKIKIVKNLE